MKTSPGKTVMRINKMITKARMIWSQILKSNSLNYFFKEMYGNKSGQFAWFVELGLKGLNSCRAKIAAYLFSIGRLLCLAFLYGWHFLNKISLGWPLLWQLSHLLQNFLTTLRIYIQLKENLIINSPFWISDPKRGHFMLEFIQ